MNLDLHTLTFLGVKLPPGDVLLSRAEDACKMLESYEKQWFTRLLDLLKVNHFVRVAVSFGYLDVEGIGGTTVFASFFDILNGKHEIPTQICYNVFPFPVEKLEYSITVFHDKWMHKIGLA